MLGNAKVKANPIIASTIKTRSGMGSYISLTNGTPIVKNFESKMITFIAVALRLNGKIRSS